MFFPVGDDNVIGGKRAYFSHLFIAANVAVFLFEFSLSNAALNNFIMTYGSIPAEIVNGEDYFTLFTSMFLHGGWMHLIGNMLFLWVFGDNIEAVIGNVPYLLFYLLGGLAASVTHIFFNLGGTIPSVGASGAIAAILGAYVVLFPFSRVKLMVPFLAFTSFRIYAIFFLGFWIFQQFVSGLAAVSTTTAQTAGVAWWAHIGGFVFGVLAGFVFRAMLPKPAVTSTEEGR